MEFILAFIPDFFSAARGLFDAFLGSTFFLVLRILLGIYALIILADIAMLTYLGNQSGKIRALKYGVSGVSENKGKRRREWKRVHGRLATDSPSEWKIAILEAEHLLAKSMTEVGYRGENLGAQLAQIDPDMYDSLTAVNSVHAFRNQIVHDDEMDIAHEQAKEAVGIYYDFLGDLGVV